MPYLKSALTLRLCVGLLVALLAGGCSSGSSGGSSSGSASGSSSTTDPVSYAITAVAGSNGSIRPAGVASVVSGASQTFTVTPASGYLVNQVLVDGAAITGDVSSYTFADVQAGHSISATFALAPVTHTIVVGQTANGTISPATTLVANGADQAFTFTPAAGYTLASILVDGVGQACCGSTYTFSGVSDNHSLSAVFAPAGSSAYTITASAGNNGAIRPAGATSVAAGANQTFTITPSAGYLVDQVTVDGEPIAGDVSSYTFVAVEASHVIQASFVVAPVSYPIVVGQTTNGTVAPGDTSVAAGASQTFTFTPATGYTVASIVVDGVSQTLTGNTYTFQDVATEHSLSAVFAPVAPSAYTIAASAGANGSVSPSGATAVVAGASQSFTFTFTPATGYQVGDVTVDTQVVANGLASYTFSNVEANHSISAAFVLAPVNYTVVVGQTAHGSVSPGTVSLAAGASQAFTFTPSSGYALTSVLLDGVAQSSPGNFTLSNIQADHSISAVFSPVGYTITASAGAGGTISSPGVTAVAAGANVSYSFTPSSGYLVQSVLVDGTPITGNVSRYQFQNVQASHTIVASFVQAAVTYTIVVDPTSHGSISPGSTLVAAGASQAFTFTPATGYAVSAITVDGVSQASLGNAYTFNNVGMDHSLTVAFAAVPVPSLLAQYGVNTNLGNPINSVTGTAVTANYNPLGSHITKLNAQQGIYLTGFNIPSSSNWNGNVTLWPNLVASGSVDWTSNLSTLPGGLTPTWLQSPHASAAGDLDQSGMDSIVTVYFNNGGSPGMPSIDGSSADTGTLGLIITSPNSASPLQPAAISTSQEFYVPNAQIVNGTSSQEIAGQIQVALCDLDGDGNLEIAVAVDSTFMILKQTALKSGVWEVAAGPYNYRGSQGYSGWWTCRLAVGDINGDGQDEVVVTENQMRQSSMPAIYHVYGSQGGTCGELARGLVIDQDDNTILSASVAIGDLLGDGGREVIFSGATAINGSDPFQATNGAVIVARWQGYDTTNGTGTLLMPGGGASTTLGLNGHVWYPYPSLCMHQSNAVAAGSNGIAPQALVALNGIWVWNTSTGALVQINSMDPNLSQGDGYQLLAAGNVLGLNDGSDQLVYPFWDPNKMQSISIYGINYTSTSSVPLMTPLTTPYTLSTYGNMASSSQTNTMFKSLCLPDWTGLSTEVIFANRSTTPLYSAPQVLTVISSPPYYSDIQSAYANLGNCFTTFGTETSSGQEQSSSFDFSVTTSFGLKFEDEVAQFEAELKTSLTQSLSYSASVSSTQTVSQSYSTPAGEDDVIYTVIPYDVYTYNLVKANSQTLTVNVPRQPQLMVQSLATFNALPGNPCQVDPALLGHTIGDPASYPSYAAVKQTVLSNGGLMASGGTIADIWNGIGNTEVVQGSESSSTTGIGAGLSIEWSLTLGGVMFGQEYDFNSEVDSTFTTGSGTTISGAVAGLPATAPSADISFWTGVCAYPLPLSTQTGKATLVTYWYSATQPN